jgi:hypothetical protein
MSAKGNGIWIVRGKENAVCLSAVKEIGVKKGKEIENGREIGGWTVKRSVIKKGMYEIVTVADDQEGKVTNCARKY